MFILIDHRYDIFQASKQSRCFQFFDYSGGRVRLHYLFNPIPHGLWNDVNAWRVYLKQLSVKTLNYSKLCIHLKIKFRSKNKYQGMMCIHKKQKVQYNKKVKQSYKIVVPLCILYTYIFLFGRVFSIQMLFIYHEIQQISIWTYYEIK